MNITEAQDSKFIKLIEFALKNPSFTIAQACKASNMTPTEFEGAKYSLFNLRGEHENAHPNADLSWRLSPEAYFNYLNFLEFKHAVATARKAHWTAIVSIGISGIIGLASLISNFT